MADNFAFTEGSGKTGAADDVGGVLYQRIKMTDGTADSSTPIAAGGGAEANALRVTIASDSTGLISIDDGGNTITVDGTVTANLSATDNAVLDAIQTAVELIDNAISGSEMQVDVLTMPTVTIQDGGGTITIDGTVDLGTTDNAVLDSIQAAVEAIQTAVEATLTIQGTVDLGATDNAVLDSIQTACEAVQTAIEATLTVSGTVTANLGATDNAVLDSIQTATEATQAAVEGTLTVDATGQGDIPVTLDTEVVAVDATGQGDVPITLDGEEITANLSATDNAVLDDIETNTDFGAVTGGGTETGALRVTIANDSTGVISIDDGGNTITVDGTVDLGATDNAVLDAIQAAVEVLDDIVAGSEAQVDVVSGTIDTVTSITNDVNIADGGNSITVDGEVTANLSATDNGVLDNIDSNTDYGAVVGGGAEATALRVTIANDSTGVISIDDGGNTITVDGTVAVTNAGLTELAAAIDTELQVDVVGALPAGDNNIGNVDLASALPAGTNAIGKLAANSGVDIGDVDVTSISAGTNNIGSVMPYAQVGSYVSGATSDITDTTATSVIAAQGAGVVIYVTTLMVSNSDATTGTVVNITDGSGGTTKWTGYAGPLGGGFVVNFNVPLVLTANTALYAACETTGANVFVNATGFKV